MIKRAYVRATLAYSGAPGARLYLARGTTDPGRTAMERNGTVASPTTVVLLDSITYGTTNVPPVTSNFPADNPAQIISTDGGSYWKGDNTAKFLRLIVDSTIDATPLAGNEPALRVGDPLGTHLRIDNNEILAMVGDATPGVLYLGKEGAGVRLGSGANITGLNFSYISTTANASGDFSINHGLGQTPTITLAIPGNGIQLQLVSQSSTQSTFRARTPAGATHTGNVEAYWAAFAK